MLMSSLHAHAGTLDLATNLREGARERKLLIMVVYSAMVITRGGKF